MLILKKMLEKAKNIPIAWLMNRETKREEFGYYGIHRIENIANPIISFIVNDILKRFNIVKSRKIKNTNKAIILAFPPSKWEAGQVLSKAIPDTMSEKRLSISRIKRKRLNRKIERRNRIIFANLIGVHGLAKAVPKIYERLEKTRRAYGNQVGVIRELIHTRHVVIGRRKKQKEKESENAV